MEQNSDQEVLKRLAALPRPFSAVLRQVADLLHSPIPFYEPPELEKYRTRCIELPSSADTILKLALELGSQFEQETALFALRQRGYYAYEDPESHVFRYIIKPRSGETTQFIYPEQTPENPTPPEPE